MRKKSYESFMADKKYIMIEIKFYQGKKPHEKKKSYDENKLLLFITLLL